MTKKKILWKVLGLFFAVVFYLGLVNAGFGIINAVIIVCMLYAFLIPLDIVAYKIISKVSIYRFYKQYETSFERLNSFHKLRYKLYFTGTKKEVEEYSEAIESIGNLMIEFGEEYISNNMLSKKQKKRVKKILCETRTLMKKTN